MTRRLSLRARAALLLLAAYAVTVAVGYVLPLAIRSQVEAIQAAFAAGLVVGFLVDELLERIDG